MSKYTDASAGPLSNEEASRAASVLVKKEFENGSWKRVIRQFHDPPIQNQSLFLFTFVPAKEAKPDAKGCFGFFKMRGAFPGEHEANAHATKLIKEVDSLYDIVLGRVGTPYPLLTELRAENVDEVNFTETLEDDLVERGRKEKEAIVEASQRYKEQNIKTQKEEYDKMFSEMKKNDEKVDDVEERKKKYTELLLHRSRISYSLLFTANELLKQLCAIDKFSGEIKELEEEFTLDDFDKSYRDTCKASSIHIDEKNFFNPDHFLYYVKNYHIVHPMFSTLKEVIEKQRDIMSRTK